MSDGKVYVSSSARLKDFGNSVEMFSDSLSKLAESLESYIDGVLESFRQQRDIVARQLEAAEEVLSVAEEAMSFCHARQRWDEEDGCYRPSCRSEEAAVSAAQREVDRIREILDRIDGIIYEYEKEKDDFYASAGFLFPPGAGCRLKWISEVHSDNAIKALDKITRDVEAYEECRMFLRRAFPGVQGADDPLGVVNEYPAMQSVDKADRFRAAIDKIKEAQVSELGDGNKADVVVKCNICGRPFSMCICQKLRERER